MSRLLAVAARELSEKIWALPGDEAFLAGLLHDIGMLALIQDLGDPYLQLLDKAADKGADLNALENTTLGFAPHPA